MAPDNTVVQLVTIAAGASLSAATVKYPGYRLVGVQTAATWDAAKLTFQGSTDGVNFFNLFTATGEYEIAAVTAGACIALEFFNFVPWDYYKVRSGTAALATSQVDATVLTLVLIPV